MHHPQNIEMRNADEYSSTGLENAARAWIENHRDQVDGWLETARAAS